MDIIVPLSALGYVNSTGSITELVLSNNVQQKQWMIVGSNIGHLEYLDNYWIIHACIYLSMWRLFDLCLYILITC